MKKARLYDTAQRMYVGEQMTYEDIAAQLPVCEKTLRTWGQDGNWGDKRDRYVDEREGLHELLYRFSHVLMDSIEKDIKDGQQVDPGRLYVVARLVDKIEKARKADDAARADDDTERQPSGLTEDTLRKIEAEVFGL